VYKSALLLLLLLLCKHQYLLSTEASKDI